MKVLGLITSLTDPSSRARILQYSDYMKKENIIIKSRYFSPHPHAEPSQWAYRLNKITKINPWRFSWIQKSISRMPLLWQQFNCDIIWQNKLVLPHQSFYERKFIKPIVFDYDDAIWLEDIEKNVAKVITKSAMVFAGNDYLADFALKHNQNTFIIPSVIDTEKLFPLAKNNNLFTIGWIGTVTNLKFLELVKPAILDFLLQNKDSRFMVVSSEKTGLFEFDNERIVFKQWSANKENELINEFSIGLMPLPDTDFTRGKCSYKMLQCMACGKPVVVSPVGTNYKILAEDIIGIGAIKKEDWFNAFTSLKNDLSFYNTCSENGRKLVENNYSVKKYYPVIAAHFKKLLNISA
jgi:glycosyltransferase involved in cell wall biosynthesis